MSDAVDAGAVRSYLEALQSRYCDAFEAIDGGATFRRDAWTRPEGGGGDTRALESGRVFAKGGVNFSHVRGEELPPSATAARPQLAGRRFEAMGVSLVMHPDNPFAPTSHANVRFFVAGDDGEAPVWWFGGGFDLTPCYPFDDDIVHWHRTAQAACAPFGNDVYPRLKAWCDRYFYLRHRDETRGVGGLFFDDLNEWGFERCFAFLRSIGDHYLPAYLPILERRVGHPYDDAHRAFQHLRRGRYVEFNLVYDRGTLFGLQSGGRTESILMSMPPQAAWRYDHRPAPDSPEGRLRDYLRPRDWLAEFADQPA